MLSRKERRKELGGEDRVFVAILTHNYLISPHSAAPRPAECREIWEAEVLRTVEEIVGLRRELAHLMKVSHI